MSLPSSDSPPKDEARPAEIKARERPRFPLPGLLFALLVVVVVHGPLLSTPPLFDEGPFLAGFSESRGAVVGMRWLPVELALFGSGVKAHRVFALAVEAGLLALAATVPLVRRARAPSLLLVALAAYVVHPWRTESFVRLGARPVLVSELLLLAGVVVAWSAARRGVVAAGLLLIAAGASGTPLSAAFALPLLWSTENRNGRGERPRLAFAVALALVVGAGGWWFAAPPPAPLSAALAGLDLLARPWATGLVHASAAEPGMWIGGAVVVALLLLAVARREAVAGAAAVAAALAFAAALRPPRTGLELLGPGLTPEAWLMPLALLLFAAWRLVDARSCTKLPLLALAGVAIGSGLVHARRFEDEAKLLDHAIAVAPDAVDLRVARGELFLREIGYAEPSQQRDFATAAYESAERALLRRSDDVAAFTLKSLALALMGRLDDARSLNDELLRAHPDDWRARACRAELESLAGDDLGALRWLRAAVEARRTPFLRAQYSALVDRIYDAIRADLADRRFEAARRRCERLVDLAPEEQDARFIRVDTFLLAGELPTALAEARKLYAEFPRDRRAVQRLASLYQQLGQPDEARDFQRVLLSLPEESGPRRR